MKVLIFYPENEEMFRTLIEVARSITSDRVSKTTEDIREACILIEAVLDASRAKLP